ncbi:Tetratricopeptide repeat protein 8 [Rhizophlyctis rosea]|nr:Tetratricopeptide repeat protein 8 [Rhizophlyctis rosea]
MHIHLAHAYDKLGQIEKALEVLQSALEKYPDEVIIRLHLATIYRQIGDVEPLKNIWKQVIQYDACNTEANMGLAALAFEEDLPEIGLRFCRRLVQANPSPSSTVWCNLALCTFQTQYFDQTVGCFERALASAEDDNALARVWYTISHVAIGIGDLVLAYRCLKVAVIADADSAEAWNNLAVIHEQLKGSKALCG